MVTMSWYLVKIVDAHLEIIKDEGNFCVIFKAICQFHLEREKMETRFF